MTGPIARAVMEAVNADEFDAPFADWRWKYLYRDANGKEFGARQSIALSSVTQDHSGYCEMGYFARTRSSGQLTDEVRAYGILADAGREVKL